MFILSHKLHFILKMSSAHYAKHIQNCYQMTVSIIGTSCPQMDAKDSLACFAASNNEYMYDDDDDDDR